MELPIRVCHLSWLQLLLFLNLGVSLTWSFEFAGYSDSCTDDIRCTPNKYLECRPGTGGFSVRRTCQCRQGYVYVASIEGCQAENGAGVGETCTNDLECSVSIKGPAVCSGASPRSPGICGCAKGHWYDRLFKECLQMGKNEESSCKANAQCTGDLALGPLSRCNPDTGKCECWDTENRGQVTGFYKRTQKCYYKKNLNEKCTFREECAVGYHNNADCLAHEAYNDEKVCQCRPGESCNGGGGQVTFSVLLLVISAFLLKQF